jgi:hypothetical protein
MIKYPETSTSFQVPTTTVLNFLIQRQKFLYVMLIIDAAQMNEGQITFVIVFCIRSVWQDNLFSPTLVPHFKCQVQRKRIIEKYIATIPVTLKPTRTTQV